MVKIQSGRVKGQSHTLRLPLSAAQTLHRPYGSKEKQLNYKNNITSQYRQSYIYSLCMCVCAQLLSCVRLFVAPGTADC